MKVSPWQVGEPFCKVWCLCALSSGFCGLLLLWEPPCASLQEQQCARLWGSLLKMSCWTLVLQRLWCICEGQRRNPAYSICSSSSNLLFHSLEDGGMGVQRRLPGTC